MAAVNPLFYRAHSGSQKSSTKTLRAFAEGKQKALINSLSASQLYRQQWDDR
jgi:hypothetical protein